MMFSCSKSQSSLSSFVSSCLFCIAITTILKQSTDRRSNYLVEAFAQQKFTGPSRILSQPVSSSASLSSSSSSSLLSTMSAPTSPNTKSTILFVSSLPDDDIYSPIVAEPLPSIIDSKISQIQEKKKKLWHHQDSGLERTNERNSIDIDNDHDYENDNDEGNDSDSNDDSIENTTPSLSDESLRTTNQDDSDSEDDNDTQQLERRQRRNVFHRMKSRFVVRRKSSIRCF